MDNSLYTLLYSINICFILTNFYGGVIKCFYRPEQYSEDFNKLFPTSKLVTLFYFLQLFEIPYLFMVGESNYLYYVNAFAAMTFPAMFGVIVQLYFFPRKINWLRFSLYMLPAFIFSFTLVLNALNVISLGDNYQNHFNWIIIYLNCMYSIAILNFMKRAKKLINDPDSIENIPDKYFPVEIAKKVYWWPITLSLMTLLCFMFNDPFVKLVRDFICIFINIGFLFFTLDPHRNFSFSTSGKDNQSNKYRLSEKKCAELQLKLVFEVTDKHLFLEQNISLDHIAKALSTNKNYLSEVLNRSHYGTFYNFINECRLNHAKELMEKHRNWKISEIANASGFSSPSTFSRLFKAATGVSPKDFEPEN